MRRLLLLTALCLLLASCSKHRVSADALEQSDEELAAPIDVHDADRDAAATAIERAVNLVRASKGLPELSTNGVLRRAAQTYAQKMVRENFFAHEDPNTPKLRTPQDRVKAAGGANPITAENLADVPTLTVESGEPFYVLDASQHLISRELGGEPIPPHSYASYGVRVVEGWMNSPGHRRNLLLDDAVQQGIGVARHVFNDVPYLMVVQVIQVREELR